MAEPSSWRELLKSVIADPTARARIIEVTGLSHITLNRWVSGVSTPRPRNLVQLLNAFPADKRAQLAELLKADYIDVSLPEIEQPVVADGIEYAFMRQIWETRANTSEKMLFWTLNGKVLEHASRKLDVGRAGIALSIVQCLLSPRDNKVHSLRETMGIGTPPWPTDLSGYFMFLGIESLAGYVVSHFRPELIDDLREQSTFLPTYKTEHEISAIAQPIIYANRIAGCLLCSSTIPGYFQPEHRRSLIADYTQLLAPAFKPEQFFPLEQVELQLMPPLKAQRKKLTTFQDRVFEVMREAYRDSRPIKRPEAEEIVWQQFEEELRQESLKEDQEDEGEEQR